ncbi:MAG: MBL fold metallo-hydrolase [Clostridia bacterium]|nr:MBL fold metallo-hydrolase [Clostridia bacterium]
MSGLTAREVLPGVFHIRDALGVYMTLLAGSDGALLVDTGYGLENTAEFVRTLTPFAPQVLLTHAHHDHALGAMWFEKTMMFSQDIPFFSVYTDRERRLRIAAQAPETAAADYADKDIPLPAAAKEGAISLGGMTAQIRLCPGHTPGSAVVYVPERKLLLTGDDWNPCTWLFFEEALAAQEYRGNVRALLELPFEHVLCPHREALYPRSEMEAFVLGLTDEALCSAKKVQMGFSLDTREAEPAPGQQFVFDFGKTGFARREEQP